MEEAELTKAINQYLADDTDNYAIMVTGPWGCGKTHFIENQLREELASSDWSIVRVSMFGITSEETFYDRLLAAIVSSKGMDIGNKITAKKKLPEKVQSLFHRDGKRVSKRLSRIKGISKDIGMSALKAKLHKEGIQLSIEAKSVIELMLGDKKLIVLDDLERCMLDETQLLGLMDTMIESQGRKVILLANEDELNRRLSGTDANKGRKSRYLSAKEKLIWRVYPFEPDLDVLSHQLFKSRLAKLLGCEDSENKEAIDFCLQSVRRPDERNVRTLKRAMSILDVLENTQYFEGAYENPGRMETLGNILALSGRVAGDECSSVEENSQDDGPRKQSYVEHFVEASIREGLSSLPFIEDYFLRGQIADGGSIDSALERFRLAYHPDGKLARNADAAIAKWQHRTFQNSDAPSIITDITGSIIPPSEGGLSFDRYREAIEVLEDLQARIPNEQVDISSIVSNMKKAIDSDLGAALNSVENGTICWQTAGFPESMKRIADIDNLREYICQKSLSSSIEAIRSILDDSDIFQPSKIIEIINNEHGSTRCAHALVSMDASLAAARLPESSNKEIRAVHRATLSTKLKTMLHIDMSEKVREWLAAFGNALDPSATEEVANRDVLEYIKHITLEAAGALQGEQ